MTVAVALGLRTRRAVAAVACVNLLTNPLLNYCGWVLALAVNWPASAASALGFLLPAEAVVIVIEWRLLLWALGGSSRRMLLISVAMNAASAAAGVVFWLT